jgi:fructuronate reductase
MMPGVRTLQADTLHAVEALGIRVPGYPRKDLQPGVVHLGLGAFHRAHQALVFDTLLQNGHGQWGVHGIAMRSNRLADALAQQDGLYSVQIADHAAIRWQVCGAVLRTSVAARERAQVIEAIGAASTRWVTLTVTEKAYAAELAHLLLDGIQLRLQRDLPGLTIASCDNLSQNGTRLRAQCLDAATSRGAEALAQWLAKACRFPNSMVDRIVPAATPARLASADAALGLRDACALGTEAFWEWAIERQALDPHDAALLASAGVRVVDDVAVFEHAKLGLLNGSHSAIAYCGAVAGLPDVAACIAEPGFRRFVHEFMGQEIAPHIRRPDWRDYRDALLLRFANPELHHSVHQIANDGSQKISQRWVPSILAQRQAGASVEHLALAAAAWCRFLRGDDERGHAYEINDPMASRLQGLSRKHGADTAATTAALLGLPEIWGDALVADSNWRQRVAHWLAYINHSGVRAAMAHLHTPGCA